MPTSRTRQRCINGHPEGSERITLDPYVLAGKPVVRGTRLAVEFVLGLLASGQSDSEIIRNYLGLTRDDILAPLAYATYLAHEYKALSPTRVNAAGR